MQNGTVNADGYVNVASHMGLSGQRGMKPSLYSPNTLPEFLPVLTVSRLFHISSALGLPAILQLWLAQASV